MSESFTHIVNLAKKSSLPRTEFLEWLLFKDEDVKAVIFGFGYTI